MKMTSLFEPFPFAEDSLRARWSDCPPVSEPEGWRLATEDVWMPHKVAYERAMKERLSEILAKRWRKEKDPILDFLFDYYSFSAGRLLRWTPGIGLLLQGSKVALKGFLKHKGFIRWSEGVGVDLRSFSEKKVQGLRWARDLLAKTSQRPPSFGCFGLHEWAMVYRAGEVRHSSVPLRVDAATVEAMVEARPLVCTHFDAFRFFTPEAQPLNRVQLDRGSQPRHEQPGCLHASMDLYKWAYKLYPWLESDLLAATFALACQARLLDMQASPYDLREYGTPPVAIETEEGRATYQARQREISSAAAPLRQALLQAYDRLLSALT